jgi:hypothetical protein
MSERATRLSRLPPTLGGVAYRTVPPPPFTFWKASTPSTLCCPPPQITPPGPIYPHTTPHRSVPARKSYYTAINGRAQSLPPPSSFPSTVAVSPLPDHPMCHTCRPRTPPASPLAIKHHSAPLAKTRARPRPPLRAPQVVLVPDGLPLNSCVASRRRPSRTSRLTLLDYTDLSIAIPTKITITATSPSGHAAAASGYPSHRPTQPYPSPCPNSRTVTTRRHRLIRLPPQTCAPAPIKHLPPPPFEGAPTPSSSPRSSLPRNARHHSGRPSDIVPAAILPPPSGANIPRCSPADPPRNRETPAAYPPSR